MIRKGISRKIFIYSLLICGGACGAFASISTAGEAKSAHSKAHPSPAQPGMTISIDPESGEMRSGSGDANRQLSPSFYSSMSTSSQGLQEVQSPDPDKGVQVNLQGRFQSPLVATRNAAGQIVIQHPHVNADRHE